MTAPQLRRIAAWTGVTLLVLATVVLVGWRVNGGRWVRVETASMGTDAPVGTLLWVAPTDFGSLQPGDLITFRPPGASSTYSHLVRTVNADGTVSTQGKISAPDPWRIGPDDVVGKVVLRWQGVGWLILAAPVLVLGALLVAVVARRLRDREARLPVAVIGAALVLAAAISVYRPLTRAEQLSFVPVEGGARATYVATGILPMRLTTAGAPDVVLRPGEVGSVLATRPDESTFTVALRPVIPAAWWWTLIAACLAPAALRSARTRVRAGAPGRRQGARALLDWADVLPEHRRAGTPGRRPRAPAHARRPRRHHVRRTPPRRAGAV